MGKKGRGKRNEENADDFASLLPSITRWRSKRNADDSASLLPSITRAGTIYALFHPVKMEENTTQLDTGAIAAQAVANAAAVEAAAAATTHALHDEDPKQTVEVIASIIAESKLEQLSTDTAALTVANAAAMKAAAGAVTFDRAAAEQTDAIDAGELAAAIIDDAEAAATINNTRKSSACNVCLQPSRLRPKLPESPPARPPERRHDQLPRSGEQATAAPTGSRARSQGSQGIRARVCHPDD